ncbi:MAG: hypothetical protein HOQ19_14755 [Gemmatimonadaceae bacterium]|nr:hypothetical protein [Gemmatimonadaceae bacterium]
MRHRRFTHFFRRRAPTIRALAIATACGLPRLLRAQASTPSTPAPPPAVAPYRLPALALVQPQDGGAVYQDRPVIVLRFAAGESTDPVDATSLTVSVDGVDRTKLFQTSAADAWGPLAPTGATDAPLAMGAHHVAARVCSIRGACAITEATISVIPNAASTAATAPAAGRSIHQRILDAALSAARRILTP